MTSLPSLLLLSALAAAQAGPAPEPEKVLTTRALGYLHAEQAHKKSTACTSAAAAANTAASTECIGAEFEKTKANYLGFVRALGALLRLDDEGNKTKKQPQRLAFDEAESAWLTYRDKTCGWEYKNYSTWAPAVVTACEMTLTQNHMAELHDAYGELFQ